MDGEEYNLEEIGEKMGMATERVAEIEARAIAKTRSAARSAKDEV